MIHFHKWEYLRLIRQEVWFGEVYNVYDCRCTRCKQYEYRYRKVKENMSIIYRPHRGGLREAMEEAREFDNIDEMLEHIVTQYNECATNKISKHDVYLNLYDKEPDNRIGWDKTYITLIGSIPHGFFTDDYKENWEEIYKEFINH